MKPKTKKSFNLDTDVAEAFILWEMQNIGVIVSRAFNNAMRVWLDPFKRRSKATS